MEFLKKKASLIFCIIAMIAAFIGLYNKSNGRAFMPYFIICIITCFLTAFFEMKEKKQEELKKEETEKSDVEFIKNYVLNDDSCVSQLFSDIYYNRINESLQKLIDNNVDFGSDWDYLDDTKKDVEYIIDFKKIINKKESLSVVISINEDDNDKYYIFVEGIDGYKKEFDVSNFSYDELINAVLKEYNLL